MSDERTPLTDALNIHLADFDWDEGYGELLGHARKLECANARLREALQRRNRDASVLRKLHEEHLAPAINIELIQAEDATDVLLSS